MRSARSPRRREAVEQPFGWAGAGCDVEAAGEGIENPAALGVEVLEVAREGGNRRLRCRISVGIGES